MNPFIWLISTIINLVIWIIIIQAIMSWLLAFQVLNLHNRFVAQVWQTLNALTEPLLRPVRRVLPNLGGIDISPVIVIIGLLFLKQLVFYLYVRM